MTGSAAPPRISVLMPAYDQAAFIGRAIASLLAQTRTDWELLIIDDGSPDATAAQVAPFLADPRIHYQRLDSNQGLGAALNAGLAQARGDWIAYLPSDDVYYADHLATLAARLEAQPAVVLPHAGLPHHYNRTALDPLPADGLQLVQTLHRRTAELWTTRAELVTDDLERMYWAKLRRYGDFVATGAVTCEWVDHPQQRHKIIREPYGGINPYRARYGVAQPLRFQSSIGNHIDEVARYRRFRERPPTPRAADGLTILLVGELAYNAERILALEERGHTLYGLWMPDPYWFNTVGPLPFGHVADLPRHDWQSALRRLQPDLIYGLLNWQAVPFVHQVLQASAGIPFVWHFKEGPFICLEKGSWPQLVDLYARADGQIYSSPELRDWFAATVPGLTERAPTLTLDGDLPRADWFAAAPTPRRAARDGQIHTVVPGRPIGLHPWTVGELAQQGIHLHFYGDFTQGQWRSWIEKARRVAEGCLHLHPQVDQERWVAEFSQYDAGWLHLFQSENGGELRRANWDDLNYPARIATLVAAGLPLLQYDNRDAIVAADRLARAQDLGIFFTDMAHLRAQLTDQPLMERLRASVWRQRDQFTFDAHADRLIAFFRQVIANGRK